MRSCLAAVVIALASAGCSSTQGCGCPAGGGDVALPADLASRVSDVTADSCLVMLAQDARTIRIIGSATGRPCHVQVALENGETLTTTVTMQSVGGCCSDIYRPVDSAPFEHTDGGIELH